MNQTDFFAMLGAPLNNYRWSWGAVRPKDKTVFLKVWTDQVQANGPTDYVKVTFHARFREKPNDHRHRERLEHVALIRDGAPCFLIMCEAKDPDARPRKMKTFDESNVYPGGRIIE